MGANGDRTVATSAGDTLQHLNVADQHKSYKYDSFCGKKSVEFRTQRQQSTINNVGQAILYEDGDAQKEQRGAYGEVQLHT
jgi:hypothetical protein